MKPTSLLQRIGLVVALTLVSVVLHEGGHYAVYRLAGVPTRISLQSVRPIGTVDSQIDFVAKLAGPCMSLAAAILLFAIALRKPSFFWATASFTNGTLRIFPCVMDLIRALQHGKPFSDEGTVASVIAHSTSARVSLMIAFIAAFSGISILAARQYPFANRTVVKVASIYALSFIVGIGLILLDELLGLSG